jgi:hypothetical protein
MVYGTTPSALFQAAASAIAIVIGQNMGLGLISLVGIIWALVLIVIGLREIHGISTFGAVVAVFGPMVVCCGGLALLLVPVFMQARQAALNRGGFPRTSPGIYRSFPGQQGRQGGFGGPGSFGGRTF